MIAHFDNDNQTTTKSAPPVLPEEVQHILERIFKSRHFAHAPKKQKFIQLICDYYLNGQASELNEYLIGREVFDRDDSYNPAADPIVRVGAHDVRKKLDLYYQNEGATDAIRLIMPVGSYEPVFVRNPACSQAEAASTAKTDEMVLGAAVGGEKSGEELAEVVAAEKEVAQARAGVAGKWLWVLGGLCAALALAVLSLLGANRKLQQQVEQSALKQPQDQSVNGPVWQPFLKDSSPTLLILSNPTVYRSANEADPGVLTHRGLSLSAEQANELTRVTGNRLPVLSNQQMRLIPAVNMYTGIGEAIGAYRLHGLLQAAGKVTMLKQSRNIGPEDLKQYSVILLGSVYSNQWSKPLSLKENFVYSNHGTIENLTPQPGEEREYKAIFDQRTGLLLEDYALISVAPGVLGEHTIMVLAGLYSEGTQAAAEFVTTSSTLNELNQALQQIGKKSGVPCYYQALLKVRVENAFPTKASLITVRELLVNNQ